MLVVRGIATSFWREVMISCDCEHKCPFSDPFLWMSMFQHLTFIAPSLEALCAMLHLVQCACLAETIAIVCPSAVLILLLFSVKTWAFVLNIVYIRILPVLGIWIFFLWLAVCNQAANPASFLLFLGVFYSCWWTDSRRLKCQGEREMA